MRRPILLILLIDLLAVAIAVIIYATTGEKNLGESGFLTKLSGAQLLAIAVITFAIFRKRNRDIERVYSLKNPRIIWVLISAGFFFLMADELFKIHEELDEMIHSIFSLKETGLTDRIDDLLVLLYALIGIGVIWFYRREFLLMKVAWPFLTSGFGLLLLMISLDILTNRDDILRVAFSPDLAQSLQTWLSFAEEGAKVLSEGMFLVAFHIGWRHAE